MENLELFRNGYKLLNVPKEHFYLIEIKAITLDTYEGDVSKIESIVFEGVKSFFEFFMNSSFNGN